MESFGVGVRELEVTFGVDSGSFAGFVAATSDSVASRSSPRRRFVSSPPLPPAECESSPARNRSSSARIRRAATAAVSAFAVFFADVGRRGDARGECLAYDAMNLASKNPAPTAAEASGEGVRDRSKPSLGGSSARARVRVRLVSDSEGADHADSSSSRSNPRDSSSASTARPSSRMASAAPVAAVSRASELRADAATASNARDVDAGVRSVVGSNPNPDATGVPVVPVVGVPAATTRGETQTPSRPGSELEKPPPTILRRAARASAAAARASSLARVAAVTADGGFRTDDGDERGATRSRGSGVTLRRRAVGSFEPHARRGRDETETEADGGEPADAGEPLADPRGEQRELKRERGAAVAAAANENEDVDEDERGEEDVAALEMARMYPGVVASRLASSRRRRRSEREAVDAGEGEGEGERAECEGAGERAYAPGDAAAAANVAVAAANADFGRDRTGDGEPAGDDFDLASGDGDGDDADVARGTRVAEPRRRVVARRSADARTIGGERDGDSGDSKGVSVAASSRRPCRASSSASSSSSTTSSSDPGSFDAARLASSDATASRSAIVSSRSASRRLRLALRTNAATRSLLGESRRSSSSRDADRRTRGVDEE